MAMQTDDKPQDKDKETQDIVDVVGAWFDSLGGRYVKTIDKATEGLSQMANVQQAIFAEFANEMKTEENKELRSVAQREFMKTFLLAGLELYRENRAQRERMQQIENKIIDRLRQSIDNMTKT